MDFKHNDMSSISTSSGEDDTERLISQDEIFQSEKGLKYFPSHRKHNSRVYIFLVVGLGFSIILNGILIWVTFSEKARSSNCPSQYTGLTYSSNELYHTKRLRNDTMDDEYWEHLSNPVAVALDHDYSDRHGLDRSIGFPWDDEKGVYFVKAFHQQHCLKGIRKVLTSPEEVKEGKLSGLSLEHNLHCIDTLLQDIMCTADDTLMPSEEIPEAIGDKQIRTCRSWDDLVAWSREPERHACYDIMSDYVPVLHTLEYYAHCPKDSPHYATMKEYFEIHGHKQIFASGPMKFGHGHDD